MDYRKTRCISYFDLGEHTIRVEVSMFTGKEEVYLDDVCVSSKRSFRFRTEHQFEVDGQVVQIMVAIKNVFTRPLEIELHVDGQLRDSDNLQDLNDELARANWINYNKRGEERPWWAVVSIILVFMLLGAAFGFTVTALILDGL